MILPDLAKRVAWYQEHLRPEDDRFGVGISDWTITAEYVPGPELDKLLGAPVWGCMGSPGARGLSKLTPEDIASRRAHILIRVPTTPAELAEIDRTLLHESGHVLAAKLNLPRDAEEEVMHSLDNLYSKLLPEEGIALARAIQNPMARAYRALAKEGDMPDPEKPEPPNGEGGDKPKMAEGAPRDVATIQGEIAKAALAGQPVDELAKELALALVSAGSNAGNGPGSPPSPMPPPEMGMKPEEAYQRAATAKAQADAVKAFADVVEGLDDGQRAMVREMPNLDKAKALVATYKRAPATEAAKMGLQVNPKLVGKPERPMARAMREAEENPRMRKMLGLGSLEEDGMHVEPGGGILIYIDGSERLRHQKATIEAAQAEKRGAA